MGGVQLGEFGHQAFGRLEGVRPFEHEFAQEAVEVAEVLGRLGLVQQLERLLRLDVQQAAEPLAIRTEGVAEVIDVCEPALEGTQVQVEAVQLGGDVEIALGDQVVTAHIGGSGARAANPVNMDQRHLAPLAVGEGERQRRPGGAAAQEVGGDLARCAVGAVAPGAADIGDQVAVAAVALALARRRVVGEPLGRREQAGDGVQQGRLAGARTPHEQEAAFGDPDVVEVLEGAPVVHLQAAHAKLGPPFPLSHIFEEIVLQVHASGSKSASSA